MPAWARESLPELPALMARSQQIASRLDTGWVDRVEAAVLHGQEGRVFDGIVLRRSRDGARVQVHTPPVDAKVPGLDADPGSRVRLRLDAVSIADGTVAFTPVG